MCVCHSGASWCAGCSRVHPRKQDFPQSAHSFSLPMLMQVQKACCIRQLSVPQSLPLDHEGHAAG